MAALEATALVKNGARLIRRANLNLHKVCTVMLTFWTIRIRSVYVFPGVGAAEHIVDLLSLKLYLASKLCFACGHERGKWILTALLMSKMYGQA